MFNSFLIVLGGMCILFYLAIGMFIFITAAPSADQWQNNNSWIKVWFNMNNFMLPFTLLFWPLHLILIFAFEKKTK